MQKADKNLSQYTVSSQVSTQTEDEIVDIYLLPENNKGNSSYNIANYLDISYSVS